jgi:histidine triad (HIT) family protein
MGECIFCDIANNPRMRHTVYEDKDVVAFLDIHPVNPGHILIIPKAHATNIYDIPKVSLAKIAELSKDVSERLRDRMQASGVSILQMNERDGDQDIMHYHLHVIPRMTDDWFHKVVAIEAWKLQGSINPTKEELASIAKVLR